MKNNNDIAISVNSASKLFKLYHNPITGPVKELLFYWNRKQYYEEFWAVKDVSMEIKRGEVVGIIGPNGAGKTTLLKMIAGLLPVDEGSIKVNGKITALLALGVGVHPEFTGRENILYGGMLLGMSKKEVLTKIDDIIEFAELGDYINRPFRTYSSGMKARLLFAISMSIDPDILIVDEALATGDSYFLRKSRDRILSLCRSGATILFVSHNLLQVDELCSRAYLMAEGLILKEASTQKVISAYNHWSLQKHGNTAVKDSHDDELFIFRGTGEIFIREIELKNSLKASSNVFASGEKMQIITHYSSNLPKGSLATLWIGFLKQDDFSWVAEIGSTKDTLLNNGVLFDVRDSGTIHVEINPLLLQYNHYCLWVIIYNPDSHLTYCEYKQIKPFFVGGRVQSISAGAAMFWMPYSYSAEVKNE